MNILSINQPVTSNITISEKTNSNGMYGDRINLNGTGS